MPQGLVLDPIFSAICKRPFQGKGSGTKAQSNWTVNSGSPHPTLPHSCVPVYLERMKLQGETTLVTPWSPEMGIQGVLGGDGSFRKEDGSLRKEDGGLRRGKWQQPPSHSVPTLCGVLTTAML